MTKPSINSIGKRLCELGSDIMSEKILDSIPTKTPKLIIKALNPGSFFLNQVDKIAAANAPGPRIE